MFKNYLASFSSKLKLEERTRKSEDMLVENIADEMERR